jgi:lipoate-protein ligase A
MAIDRRLAALCAGGAPRAIVRTYRMNPPAVTIGRNQRWRSVVDEAVCRDRGWDWVRRPTGGGALLHCHEINYAVAVSNALLGKSVSFRLAYERIMHGLAHALELLGVTPVLNLGRSPGSAQNATTAQGLCAQSLTRYEIAVDGRKAVAAAQRHWPEAILQHGTIYIKAPSAADRFWPSPDDRQLPDETHWWDTSALPESRGAVQHVERAVRDGLAAALQLTWREIGFDEIGMSAVDAQVAEWAAENWNTRR